MDGDSSGRDEMATQERTLIQIVVRSKQQVDIVVIRVTEAEGEAVAPEEQSVVDEGEIGEDIRSLYVKESPYREDLPTSLDGFGLCFRGEQLMSCIDFPVNISFHSFF